MKYTQDNRTVLVGLAVNVDDDDDDDDGGGSRTAFSSIWVTTFFFSCASSSQLYGILATVQLYNSTYCVSIRFHYIDRLSEHARARLLCDSI